MYINGLSSRYLHSQSLYPETVTFGLLLQSKGDELCINTIVCLAKFFIHKCRTVKSSPKFVVFLKEFELYIKSLKTLKGPKAQKIYDTLKLFPTEING